MSRTLWCEWPDQPHPTCPIGSDGPGEIVFTRPKEWLVKAAPYVVVTTAVTIGMGAKFFGIHRLAGLVPFTPSCAR